MIQIRIITPTGLYLEEEVEAVHVKTVEGERTLLPNHIAIVAVLVPSRCSLKVNGEYVDYAIAGGMLHMQNNEIRILADSIEGKDEIDVERAMRAKKRAEERLAKKDHSTNVKRAQVALSKAVNRISVATK